MANYRLATLLATKTVTTAGTETIDVDVAEPISQIQIVYKGTNNGNTPTAHPCKMISKVELVDGSQVLWSLSGLQALALDFFNNKKPAMQVLNWQDNVDIELVLNINFGRFLWDPQFAFLPKRFTNPQLKITHNKASGGSDPDASTMQILAFVFDEKSVSPVGFLMAKEVKSWTMASAAYEYTDLPKDYAYRLLCIQSLVAGQEIQALFSNVKLDTDNDKKILFDHATLELLKIFGNQFGPYVETHEGIVGTGEISFYITPTTNTHVVTGGFGGTRDYFAGYAPWGGKVGIYGGASGEYFQSVFSGFAPNGVLAIPLGLMDDPTDWFDPLKVGTVRLTVLGAAAQTANIFLQQLRRY